MVGGKADLGALSDLGPKGPIETSFLDSSNLDTTCLGERSSTYEIESLILGPKDIVNNENVIFLEK